MTSQAASTTYRNARIVTCEQTKESEYGLLPGTWAITVCSGVITALTPMSAYSEDPSGDVRDLHGMIVTPGLIDCHTHIVFAGDRTKEWEARLRGESYESIAKSGGGILSTTRATRASSEDELLISALERLRSIAAEGVTCIEIKSGYGLSLDDEIKLLSVIQKLKQYNIAEISPTLLAAHAVPSEFRADPESYIDLVCDRLIPLVAREGLAEAVDVFCDQVAFSLPQCERVFETAKRHGLAVKAHAEQLSWTGCARRATEYNAWSVDHLEHLSPDDVVVLAASTTTAVLLPGAYYALREVKKPPVEMLRAAGVPIAVATDCNPGTSPFTSLRLMAHMACVLFTLSPAEALGAITRSAARALGRSNRLGTIACGKEATLCVWDVGDPAAIICDLTRNPLVRVIIRGEEHDAQTA